MLILVTFGKIFDCTMFLLWILLLAGGAWLLIRFLRDDDVLGRGSSSEDPMAVLRRRYAEGEISAEEYEERKARLEQDRQRRAVRQT